jgi:hypothetical protein
VTETYVGMSDSFLFCFVQFFLLVYPRWVFFFIYSYGKIVVVY